MARIPEHLTSRAQEHPSVYDERPGYPRNSNQGYLFRNMAPARGDQRGSSYTREGDELGNLYHGTSADLKPGEAITPGHQRVRAEDVRIGMNAAKNNSSQYVYASADPGHAWQYAKQAAEATGGEPRVYQVGFQARNMERDPEYYRNHWDSAQGQDRARYHQDDPTNPWTDHAENDESETPEPFDENGNYIAFRSKRPMYVRGDVTEHARASAQESPVYDDYYDEGY